MLDVIAQLLREWFIRREVVAFDARLLDGDEIPMPAHQVVLQTLPTRIEAELIRGILLEGLHLAPVQFQARPADIVFVQDQGIPGRLRQFSKIVRGIVRKAIAHREQPDGLRRS
ncbi:MAG: hypothetical protein WDN28_08985 [Chthoniobacter sp.]